MRRFPKSVLLFGLLGAFVVTGCAQNPHLSGGRLYRSQKIRIEADLLERGTTLKPEIKKHYESMLARMNEEEARYVKEKKEIEQEAKKLEHERDINRSKDPYFDYAEVLLQISIVMASISILAVSRQIFYFAIVLASLGSIMSLNGFLLLFRLPFLH